MSINKKNKVIGRVELNMELSKRAKFDKIMEV